METIVGSLLRCGGGGGGGLLFSDVNVVSVSCITSTGDCTCPQHQQTTVRRQSEGVPNVHVDLKPTFYKHVTSPFTKKLLLFIITLIDFG